MFLILASGTPDLTTRIDVASVALGCFQPIGSQQHTLWSISTVPSRCEDEQMFLNMKKGAGDRSAFVSAHGISLFRDQ